MFTCISDLRLIFSPDTDVYHIGLVCANLTSTEVIIQLSSISRGKPVYMQNFRFIGAMVSEFRFFKKKKMKNMDNLIKLCLPVFRTSYDIFIHFFACCYFFTCSPS